MSIQATGGARTSLAPLWAALAACALLLAWIANGAAVLEGDRTDAWHHYEYLVDGFLRGHASISVDPAPELLRLRDPYDPAQNGPWRLWDASLYRGKFYLYFGPTPALLMLPWRVATGHHLPQRLAVAVFAAGGVAALALLIAGVRRRHFPGLGPLAAGGILVTAMCASWLPVTIRRPDVWELPLVAACACLWWALYFLWRSLDSEKGAWWALAAGAAVALILGSRPTCVFAGAVVLLCLFEPRRPAGPRLALAAAVAAAGGLALLAYNVARFGHPLEFGQSYQLWGTDERLVRHFSPLYAPYNAWLYLFSLPDLSPYFPFVLAVPPGGEPPGYLGIDEMHGALFGMPVHLASLAALAWAWRRRGDAGALALRRTIWAAALASALSACVLFCFAGATSRYITEVFAGSTVATAIGLMAILGGGPGGRARNVVRLLALCAAAWTVGYVALASAEHRILFRRTRPAAYAAAARLLDYPSAWASRGEAFGPVEVAVRVAPGPGLRSTVLVSSGRPGMMNQLILERTDPDHARLVLAENALSVVIASPAVRVEGGLLRARIDAPWLYPPPQSPWWDAVADPGLRGDLQTRFSIAVGGTVTTAHTAHFFDPIRFEPWVTTRGSPAAGTVWVESIGRAGPPAR
ncbi:MAG: hypothetical protein ABSH26_05350 [Opitutaceae bacterium]|jgi:hypothetical protein